jgi:hypothetical protein
LALKAIPGAEAQLLGNVVDFRVLLPTTTILLHDSRPAGIVLPTLLLGGGGVVVIGGSGVAGVGVDNDAGGLLSSSSMFGSPILWLAKKEHIVILRCHNFFLKRYARAQGVSNMPERREYWPEIRSRFGVGVRSFS